MRFAIFGNTYQVKKSAPVVRLLSILDKRQAEVYIHREFYQFLTKEQKLDIRVAGVFDGNNFEADMVLSMGGDGTFLKAASYVEYTYPRNQHRPFRFLGRCFSRRNRRNYCRYI